MSDPRSLPPLPTGPGEPFSTPEIVLVSVSLLVGIVLLVGLALVFA